VLDLDTCPFLRKHPRESGSLPLFSCLADDTPQPLSPERRRQQCLVAAHADCPRLLVSLAGRSADAWSEIAAASRVTSEACYLAQARLEVQAATLAPLLERLFGRSV
jgi:hypothetical protein